jgi:anti-sigma factor (TIGR02949 family)
VTCDLTQTRLHAYFDGELDAIGAAEFERHLESCPDCETRLAAEEKLRSALVGAQLYARAPETLRRKLQTSLPAATTSPDVPYVKDPKPSAENSWRWLAIAASLILAVFLGTEYMERLTRHSQQQAMAAVIVDAHLRSLQPGHLEDVISTDQHTVKPWFDGKIDFAPDVHDFSGVGFPLLGGRLDVIAGQSVAALVYGRRKHVINVFVMESENSPALTGSGELHGYHWLSWRNSGFTYIAVSDVSTSDLEQLRDLFQKP